MLATWLIPTIIGLLTGVLGVYLTRGIDFVSLTLSKTSKQNRLTRLCRSYQRIASLRKEHSIATLHVARTLFDGWISLTLLLTIFAVSTLAPQSPILSIAKTIEFMLVSFLGGVSFQAFLYARDELSKAMSFNKYQSKVEMEIKKLGGNPDDLMKFSEQ